MPVGGSRHYQGGGLGQVGMWACPSCGEDNTGPLEQGCNSCGAGRPRAAAPPPPTPPVPEPPTPPVLNREPLHRDAPNEFEAWIARHQDATLEQAFIAGFIEGQRAARRQQIAAEPPPPQEPAMPGIDARTYRTTVAALIFFRDQVLVERPEEIAAGEWLSAEDATAVIDQLEQLLGSERGGSHAV